MCELLRPVPVFKYYCLHFASAMSLQWPLENESHVPSSDANKHGAPLTFIRLQKTLNDEGCTLSYTYTLQKQQTWGSDLQYLCDIRQSIHGKGFLMLVMKLIFQYKDYWSETGLSDFRENIRQKDQCLYLINSCYASCIAELVIFDDCALFCLACHLQHVKTLIMSLIRMRVEI